MTDLSERECDKWRRELLQAGWTPVKSTLWRSPRGALFTGPHQAWLVMQMRKKRLMQKGTD